MQDAMGNKGRDCVSLGKGVLWRKLGIPANLGHDGEWVCLVKGVLTDVMLSIPLIQGTKGVNGVQ